MRWIEDRIEVDVVAPGSGRFDDLLDLSVFWMRKCFERRLSDLPTVELCPVFVVGETMGMDHHDRYSHKLHNRTTADCFVWSVETFGEKTSYHEALSLLGMSKPSIHLLKPICR